MSAPGGVMDEIHHLARLVDRVAGGGAVCEPHLLGEARAFRRRAIKLAECLDNMGARRLQSRLRQADGFGMMLSLVLIRRRSWLSRGRNIMRCSPNPTGSE